MASWHYPLWIGWFLCFLLSVLVPDQTDGSSATQDASDFSVVRSLKGVSRVRCLV